MARHKKLTLPYCQPTLDDATRALIRGKARQLARRAEFTFSDLPDLEQDLTFHVWTRLCRYDPTKGDPGPFVRMLLAHAVSCALRTRRRLARRAPESLDALLQKATAPVTEPVDPTAVHADAIGLALDVGAVLVALPRPLRRVAEALKTRSVAAAACHLRLSRAAVYRRLTALREAFTAAGLEQIGAPRADTRHAAGVVP